MSLGSKDKSSGDGETGIKLRKRQPRSFKRRKAKNRSWVTVVAIVGSLAVIGIVSVVFITFNSSSPNIPRAQRGAFTSQQFEPLYSSLKELTSSELATIAVRAQSWTHSIQLYNGLYTLMLPPGSEPEITTEESKDDSLLLNMPDYSLYIKIANDNLVSDGLYSPATRYENSRMVNVKDITLHRLSIKGNKALRKLYDGDFMMNPQRRDTDLLKTYLSEYFIHDAVHKKFLFVDIRSKKGYAQLEEGSAIILSLKANK